MMNIKRLVAAGIRKRLLVVSARYEYCPCFLFNETEVLKSDIVGETGQRTNNAPKYSGSLTARYGFTRGRFQGLAFGAGWTHMGLRREGGSSGAAARWSEGWDRVDLFATYRTKFFNTPTTFSFNVKNVTDKVFRVDRDTYAAGREFRFGAGLSF